MSWGNNDKGFGFVLSMFIVASVIQAISVVSLTEALVEGNGSYTLWPLVVLTLGYDNMYSNI